MKRLLMLLTLILMACTEQAPVETGTTETVDKPVVVTSNYPLYFFASEIAGDAVDVQFPEIDGDPAFWAPDGDDAALLQTANLVILNGAGYESWLAFTTLHEGRMLDTTAGLSDRLLPMDEAAVHQHGPEGEHSHEGTAFTTWLNPRLAAEQARQVTQGLTSLVPDQAERFTTRLTALEDRLNVLDAELERAFESLADESVIWSHPVYQYLQHRYAIDGRSVHWEPDQAPGTFANGPQV
jgi:zinc transport system substrate-binding protein